MDIKNKVLYFDSKFTAKAASEDDDSIMIEGYASTNDRDRQGDVVPAGVWKTGMVNYLKNPIILAYHNHTMPIGKMVDYKADEQGLWIKAQIPSEIGDVYKLIKKGILSAFSIGFRVKDAEYRQEDETFMIKDLELHEISVVSVPANQNTLFSLAKAFDNAQEFELFKQQFAEVTESAKGLEPSTQANSDTTKEWNMDPKELEKLLADAAAKAAEQTARAVVEAQAKAAQELQRKADEEAQLQAKIKAAVSAVQTVDTGAEKLLAEVEKRLAEQADSHKSALEGLETALREKAAELEAIQKSRMQFTDARNDSGPSYHEKEKAILLSKISGKSIEDTKFGKDLVQKYAGSAPSPRIPAAIWETEVSTNLEAEMRKRLVVAGTVRQIAMNNPIMKIPVNPEAGYASWVANTDFGNSNNNSSGSTATHQLKEITLSSYKLATREYIAFEEDEDALLAILPVVRDAMTRRMAKSVDKAMLFGLGTTTADPVKGIAEYDASSAVTLDISNGDKLTVAKLQAARKDLAAWGLTPSDLIIFVGTSQYYELLEDSNFLTVDKVGDRATILTGQIGSVANTPVIVSGEFVDASPHTATEVAAVIFNPMNFIVGNQRGMRVDTDDLIERQSRVLVASLRMGMTQVSTVDGPAVSTIRYVA
jgi:HK97 family phage prohead protease/HK97 family phage major capsid protein